MDDIIYMNPSCEMIKKEHICYYVRQTSHRKNFYLYEVYCAIYPHPDAPEDATIKRMEKTLIKTVKDYEPGAHKLILLYHCHGAIYDGMTNSKQCDLETKGVSK